MGVIHVFAAFVALSGSAIFGYVVCALLVSAKVRDLEHAYRKLSRAIQEFLKGCPTCEAGMLALATDDLCKLHNTLKDADAIAGLWTIEDYRR